MASRREAEKQKARRADARAWAEKEDRGWEPTAVKLPEGVNFFTLKRAGFYKIDVIPYVVGKGNPFADKGLLHFERSYFVHRGLGLTGKQNYCCLAECWGKKCPVCEHLSRHGGEMDPDLVKKQKAQWRHLWNVIDTADPEKGIQVWDTAHWKSFGEMIKAKIKAVDAYADFSELTKAEGGMTLQLSVADASFAGQNFKQVTNIEMLPRKKDYDESIIDKAVCLDEALVQLSYDALKTIYFQEEEGKNGNGRTTLKTTARKPADDDEDEDEPEEGDKEEPEEEEEEPDGDDEVTVGSRVAFVYRGKGLKGKVVKIDEKKGLATIKSADGIHHVDVDELTVVEGDDESPGPVKAARKPAVVEDEEEEEPEEVDEEEEAEDEPEEEEEEAPRRKKR